MPANFSVTRTADDLAAGSLRRAITDANATAGPDTISFNIPGSGVQTINLTADLPAITEAVTIDGYTQPGAAANTLAVGTNATLLIELNGSMATDGLVITATGSIIRGLVINRFSNDGIKLDGSGAISNVIEGNFIGVDTTGSSALPNLGDGINVRQASGNTIGGTTPEARNVISGNGVRGILIRANSTGNVVQGNYIGTDAAGVNAVANATSGIRIADGSDGNLIGGTIPEALNLISGNGNHGVLINDAANNLVQGNLIGTDAAGAPALGNSQSGVLIENGSTNNSVGGSQLGAGNVIAFNSNGVSIAADSAGNPIQGNRISGNGSRGIDLGDDGSTPNDLGDEDSGANNLQNFPVLFSAEAGSGVTVVNGTLNSTPNTEFNLEFFHNDNPGSEGTAQGDVRVIPTTTPTVVTDEFGNVSFSFTFTENLFGRFITATATRTSDPRDTSEFSDPVECVEAASFVVSTTLDVVAADGLTSLREAMLLANSSFGFDTISFNIPGNGVQAITLSSQLPTITQSVVIDGYTQPGASPNTRDVGSDAVLLIELNGNNAVSTGLTLASFFSTIRGLVINRFTQSGILLDGFAGAEGNAIVGNFIGTDPTGTLDRGNGGDGIRLDAGSFGFARNNFIGGPTPQARNVISGNGSQGIEIFATGAATGTTIQNNYIGTNAAGTLGLGNSGGGVAVLFEDATRIENNLISGNTGFGVELFGSVEGTLIQGNRIGTNASGTSSLGNSGNGVSIDDSAANNNTTVGNTIAFNGGNGVSLTTTGSGNVIRGNAIHTNGGLGINLGADAVTPNDTGDADSGPNNLQNFPELLSVFSSGGDTTLVGTLHSTPNTTFELDFFRNAAADLSGFGEGEILLEFFTPPRVTTDANGDVLFTFSFSGDFLGQFFTATATRVDSPFDTSEFSAAVRAAAAPSFVVDTTADTVAADGVTSLREAILLANALPGLNTITFNIPGSGVQTIALTAALPTISDAVVIDGYSQPGASPNTRALGSDAALLIELDGTSAGAGVSGLTISSTGNTIRGLVINRFAAAGMRLIGAVATGSFIEGNYIGVDPTGALSRPNGGDGIELSQAGNNLIGGSTPAARNVIAGNDGHGILVVDFLTDIGSLAVADQLLAGAIPASTVSGSIPQADLNDVFDTFNGSWTFNHPVPGGGGDNYAFLATGTVVVASDGLYSFAFSSDDGGRVSIDGAEIIAVPNDRQFLTSYATIFLSAGEHSLDWVGYEHFTTAAFELSVAVGDNTTEVTAANGWRVLGAPDALGDIQLQDDLDLTVFYPLAGVGGNAVVGNYIGVSASGADALGNTLDGVRVVNAAGVQIGTDGDGVADENEGNVIAANGRNGVFLSGQRLPVLTLNLADQLIDGTLPSGQASGTLPQADLADQSIPALGAWAFDNPIPGGGGAGYAFRATGTLTVASAGVYSFALGSDDGGRVRVDGQSVVQFDFTRPFVVSYGSVMLDAGVHTLEWVGFQAEGPGGFELSVALGVNTSEVTLANGWRVLGGPAVLPEIQLQGDLDLSVYYAVAPDSAAVIAGNLIGLDAAGGSLGNTQNGVQLFSANGVRIGTNGDGFADAAERNRIGTNGAHGVFIQDSVFNAVAGNVINGNSRAGVRLEQALFLSGPAINGVRVENNEIAFNGAGGVVLVSAGASRGNAIRGNAIFANSGPGIDLNFDGQTANDPLDADVGVNNLQNFPVLTGAVAANGVTTISGTLSSTPNTTFVLDFFRNGDPGEGSAEGETPISPTTSATVTTDETGTATFSFSFVGNFFDEFFTATATRADAPLDTSEFSDAIRVVEAASLVVTTTADVVANDGETSLREAILLANELPGLDAITFAIPGAGVQTITLSSALPILTDGVTIDGYTQPGASPNTRAVGNNAVLLIELSGGDTVSDGLVLRSTGSTLRGLVVNRFVNAAVRIEGAQTGSNTIEGNWIGVDPTGTVARGNFDAILIQNDTTNNLIGGTTPQARNVLSGNFVGITLFGNPTANRIQGNYIGTDASGTADLGNSFFGISFLSGANNLVSGNVISGNNIGIGLSNDDVRFNVIQGNLIGTDATGTASLGNDGNGITLQFSSAFNTIGGDTPGAGNVISANGGAGIGLQNADDNTIQGNLIGTDITGTQPLGNSLGIDIIIDSSNNLIGGGTPGAGNVIAANRADGVFIDSSANRVQGNFIGTDATGTLDLGNTLAGVFVGFGATGNIIGADADHPEAGNVIAFNFKGVVVGANGLDDARGITIRRNSIFANEDLGIDLGDDGPTPNDPDDGDASPNDFQNTPVLTEVVGATIRGVLASNANGAFLVDIYATSLPSVPGQGKVYLGSVAVTTDDFGQGSFELTATIPAGHGVTATSTNLELGNTSEFSPGPPRSLELTGFPSPTPAGTPQSFLVRAVDDFGSTAIGYVGTVNFSTNETRAVFVNLPGPFTFSPADNGVRTFSATFFRGGLKTLTVTDVATPALTASQTNILIASNLAATGELILPVEGVAFTGTVATFRDISPAPVTSYTAVIDWGDGTPMTPGIIVATANGFEVQGTHTFAQEATFLVDVLIARPALFLAEVAETTAEVLTNRQAQRLIDFDADRCSPGDDTLDAQSQGIDATLRDLPRGDDDCDVTLFVATFNGNPTPAPVNGAAFYDLRVLGTEEAGQLIVEFAYPPSRLDAIVQLLFFDGTSFQPVAGSELRPLSLVNDPLNGVIRVVFDASSVPRLNDLRGTVLTVTVSLPPSSGEVPTPVTPSVAIAATSGVAITPALTSASRTIVTDATERTQPVAVNFRTNRTLNITLSPDESGATDAPRTSARSGSAADDQDKEEALETMLRWLRSMWQQGWLRTLILPGMGQARPASAPMPVVPASALPEAEQPEALDAYFSAEQPAPAEEEAPDGIGLPLLFAAGVMGAAGQRSRRYTQKKSRRAPMRRPS